MSKTFPVDAIEQAIDAGERRFGENYVQEGLAKVERLAGRGGLEWHLIGPLQSNKSRAVAAAFDWVQSIDRVKTAERLSAQRPPGMAPLKVCLQVNISGEASKGGFAPGEVAAAADAVAAMAGLSLRGLMAIPEPVGDFEAQRAPHRALRLLYESLCRNGHALDTLSMGMSGDLEAAIAEGSTLVRVGSAIFGARSA